MSPLSTKSSKSEEFKVMETGSKLFITGPFIVILRGGIDI